MAIEYMVAVLQHSRARLGDRLVMLALANYADAHGRAWPSLGRIAEGALMSERQVRRALRKLEKSGELELERKGGQFQGQNYANNFRITLPLFTNGGDNLSGGGDKSRKKVARNVRLSVMTRHKIHSGEASSPGPAQARASFSRLSQAALGRLIGQTKAQIDHILNPVGRTFNVEPTDPDQAKALRHLREKLGKLKAAEKARKERA